MEHRARPNKCLGRGRRRSGREAGGGPTGVKALSPFVSVGDQATGGERRGREGRRSEKDLTGASRPGKGCGQTRYEEKTLTPPQGKRS